MMVKMALPSGELVSIPDSSRSQSPGIETSMRDGTILPTTHGIKFIRRRRMSP